MSTVRAKFTCNSITRRAGWKAGEVVCDIKLTPVVSGSEENKSFYAATPCGEINLGTTNDAAVAQFELGKEYYVDFSAA